MRKRSVRYFLALWYGYEELLGNGIEVRSQLCCQLIAAEHGQKRPGEIQTQIAKETGEPRMQVPNKIAVNLAEVFEK